MPKHVICVAAPRSNLIHWLCSEDVRQGFAGFLWTTLSSARSLDASLLEVIVAASQVSAL